MNTPVRSSPGKLTQLLYRRFCLGLKGFIILSCKLVDHNGEGLERCCLRYVGLWGLGEEFRTWFIQENGPCSTLVDYIVAGFPRDEHERLCRKIGKQDSMIGTTEMFHSWVAQRSHGDELPLQKAGFHVIWTSNVDPYRKRKVCIPNGAHTSMMLGAHLYGPKTVGECPRDEKVSILLRGCIFGEIIPAIGDTKGNRKFGEVVSERFSSPFIKHVLLSIALNSVSKFRTGVLPTILECRDMSGSCPQGLTSSLVAPIMSYHIDDANDSRGIMDSMKTTPVEDILKREDCWGQDLSPLPEDVKKRYELIETEGMFKACDAVLSEAE